MKDLFKKKQGAKQPATKPSKGEKSGLSLSLGKKTPKTDTAKPKKAGLGFGKKPVMEETDGIAPATKAKPKVKAKTGGKGLDTNKLILILGGLLVAIVLALGAKMFLFSEEPAPVPPPVVEITPPPAPVPPPADTPVDPAAGVPAEGVPPTDMPVEGASPVVSEGVSVDAVAPPVVDPNQAPPVEGAVPAVPATPTTPVAPSGATPVAVAPAPVKISEEEFLQESNRRIYRERNTGAGQ